MKKKGLSIICAAVLTAGMIPQFSLWESSTADADTKTGDINQDGYIDTEDISLLQNYIAKKTKLIKARKEKADIDGNGSVNVLDLALLKRQLISWILPAS